MLLPYQFVSSQLVQKLPGTPDRWKAAQKTLLAALQNQAYSYAAHERAGLEFAISIIIGIAKNATTVNLRIHLSRNPAI
jgi:hypothetical protein